ncbi:MAG: phage portal protein [Clostridiales bacterium]|uniref:phage portal protein n=1 Tax=Zhenhengia sp. TaxID=2944208 RepID=UPI0029061FE2|nr:phage portal protein [Clostridiales bacterium]
MSIKNLSKLFKSRDKPTNALGSAYTFFFGGTTSGKTVNERTAMQTTAVYACVRILAETIASLPLHTYRSTSNGKEKAKDHYLYYLLHNEPNPEMTSFVFRETLMSHLLLWGNAYAQIIRDGSGKVVALYPLMPDKMTVDRTSKGEIYYLYNKEGIDYPLKKEEVLHIPGLGFDGLIGYSPIAMAKNAIGMAIATEEYGASFFANGANPGGVLEHPGIVKDPARIRDSWNAVYGGSNKAHKVAVLEEGMSFKTITIPPDQAQFLETRKFQTNEIARIFRIPPHMIGDLERATFSNIENQSLEFVKYTLDPWVVRLEMSMQRALLMESEKRDYFIKLNVDGLLRGDYASRMQGYATGIQNGFLSPNDVRRLEDMNTIEHGDIYAMNGNMLKLEDVGAYAKTLEKKEGEDNEEVLELGKERGR